MSKKIVIISAHRQAYRIDNVLKHSTMTVGELVKFLEENFDEDSPLILSHDNGYTYGALDADYFREAEVGEDGEEIEAKHREG